MPRKRVEVTKSHDFIFKLHPTQYQVYEDKHRFKVVSAGRRWGKTRLAWIELLEDALKKPDSLYWWVASIYKELIPASQTIRETTHPDVIAERSFERENILRYLKLYNGTEIYFHSGNTEDSLRGSGLDGLVIDEAGSFPGNRFSEELRPSLMDKEGWGIFIGCITDDAWVLTHSGIKQLRDLNPHINNKQIQPLEIDIFGLNGIQQTGFFWDNGITETIKIKTRNGFELEGTPNHPVWAKHTKYRKEPEWIQLKDLTYKSLIAIQLNQNLYANKDDIDFEFNEKTSRHHKINIPKKTNEELAYLIGLILGDGYVGDRRISIRSADEEVIQFLKNKPLELNFNTKTQDEKAKLIRVGSDEFIAFLNWLGYKKVKAREKIIPHKCLEWSEKNVLSLLRGLFDSDGSCGVHKTGKTRINFVSTSKKMIEQVQMLLLNAGIMTNIGEYNGEPTKKAKVYSRRWTLEVCQPKSIKRFGEKIGFNIERKMKALLNYDDSGNRTIYEEKEEYDIIWRRVKEIIPSKAHTYDLNVPNGHSYFSNGMISHNTPKGRGWFYDMWQRGNDTVKFPEYKSWQFSSYENSIEKGGYLKTSEIDSIALELPELIFKQEILANFLKGEGDVFRNIHECIGGELGEPEPDKTYVIGADLAKTVDWTVLVAMDNTGHIRGFRRFKDLDWTIVRREIKNFQAIYNKYSPSPIILDSSGVGDPVYDELFNDGVLIRGYKFTNQSKRNLIENLSLCFDQRRVTIPGRIIDNKPTPDPNVKVLTEELEAFTYDVLPSGVIRYGASGGKHDDSVIGTGLAAWGVFSGGVTGSISASKGKRNR